MSESTFESKCILVVDDHVEIVKTVAMNFKARGYRTLAAPDAKTALKFLSEMSADAMILDLGLPDMDGIDLLIQIRSWSEIPILILSGRTELDKKLTALKAGADDYISKPFEVDELVARVEAVFRRIRKPSASPIFYIGKWKIDLASRLVEESAPEKGTLHLTPIEWRILESLLLKSGSLVTQKDLLRAVWGANYEKETNYLRLYIGQLRKKIEPNPQLPQFILTEPGIGYRLMARQVIDQIEEESN